MQQVESPQSKSVDNNILEMVVPIPEQVSNPIIIEEEPKKNLKHIQAFSLSKELEKVKIQVPLLKLSKTLGYKKEIFEFINLSQIEDILDTVNLKEENPVVNFGPHVEELYSFVPPF